MSSCSGYPALSGNGEQILLKFGAEVRNYETELLKMVPVSILIQRYYLVIETFHKEQFLPNEECGLKTFWKMNCRRLPWP
jgi:hypothetical protein